MKRRVVAQRKAVKTRLVRKLSRRRSVFRGARGPMGPKDPKDLRGAKGILLKNTEEALLETGRS